MAEGQSEQKEAEKQSEQEEQKEPEDERLKIVYDEALRLITAQQGRVDNLRTRATTVTATAALVSTFLGAPVLKDQGMGWPSATGLVALSGVVVVTLAICAPWWTWNVHTSTPGLLEAVDEGFTLNQIRRNMAKDFDKWAEKNDKTLRLMSILFSLGLICLVVEMAAWTIPLWNSWK